MDTAERLVKIQDLLAKAAVVRSYLYFSGEEALGFLTAQAALERANMQDTIASRLRDVGADSKDCEKLCELYLTYASYRDQLNTLQAEFLLEKRNKKS